MLKFFDNDVIEFFCDESLYGVIPEPKEASKFVPEWFKKIKPYDGREQNGFFRPTVKKCLPVLDAMSLGYIIPLQADVHVITNHDLSIIKAGQRHGNQIDIFSHHNHKQVHSSAWPVAKQDPIKFHNYWTIKTKPGWSCMFTAPMNHLGTPFTCLSGVVDTDTYPKEVNFPAIWNQPNFDDVLRAGTPLVQVIPFKRTSLKKPKVRVMSKKEKKYIEKLQKAQSSRVSVYTEELREKR